MDVGDELARKGKWFALIVQETGQGKKVRLYLKYRSLGLTFLTLMVVGFFGSAVGLTLWLDRKPHNLVTFQDVALPWRWAGLNALRGEGFARQGMAELEGDNARRGMFYLQRGLSLKPDNEQARLALGQLYAEANYYEGVSRTLQPQLAIRFSREVAQLLFTHALRADDYPFVVDTAGTLRTDVEPNSEDDLWLVDQQAKTLLSNKKPAAALEILRASGTSSVLLKTRLVQALVETEKYDEAWVVAESVTPAFPGMERFRLKLQAMVRSAQGDEAAALKLLDQITEDRANMPTPWLFGIDALVKAGMNDSARIWIGDYLTRFGAQTGAVNQLLLRLANTDNPAIMRYTSRRIKEWQALNPNQRFMLALVLIQEGEWDGLAEDFADMIGDDQQSNMLNVWLNAVFVALKSDNPPELLIAFLGEEVRPIIVYQSMAQGFAQDERWDLVKLVVDAGKRHHRFSASLQHWEGRAAEQLEDVVVEVSQANEASDALRFRYTEEDVPELRLDLRRSVEAENWDEIASVILRIRRQHPAWMGEIEPMLDWSEAHLAAATGNFARLRVVAPAVMRRDGEMAGWVTDQAELAVEAGHTSSAIKLLEAVLVEEKFYHRARKILKELTMVIEPDETDLSSDL